MDSMRGMGTWTAAWAVSSLMTVAAHISRYAFVSTGCALPLSTPTIMMHHCLPESLRGCSLTAKHGVSAGLALSTCVKLSGCLRFERDSVLDALPLPRCFQTVGSGAAACRWVTGVLDMVEGTVQAALVLYAVGCFSRIVSTEGNDLHLLMDGISSRRGVTSLFARLAKVQQMVRVTVMLLAAQVNLSLLVTVMCSPSLGQSNCCQLCV